MCWYGTLFGNIRCRIEQDDNGVSCEMLGIDSELSEGIEKDESGGRIGWRRANGL